MADYLIFERHPRSWGDPVPKNPDWPVAVYQIVGETPQRILLAHAGGDKDGRISRDSHGRLYADRFTVAHGDYDTPVPLAVGDLEAALAYRKVVQALWVDACAARDAVALPLITEIARLQGLIRDADKLRDDAAERIREIEPATPKAEV